MSYRLSQRAIALLLGMTVLIGGCSSQKTNSASTSAEEALDITVSILPQAYFVKKIGGDRVKVNVMVEPGVEPHIYEPKPQQLQALSVAEAYITIGVPFEQAWQDKFKAANPQMTIIASDRGIQRIRGEEHEHEKEKAANSEPEHHEKTLDPHIWLSPRLVKIQAQNIYDGLVKVDPAYQNEYKANLDLFLAEIEQLDRQIQENLAGIKNRKFIVFHPAWGYFARDYNLQQIPIEVEGQEPSAAELGTLIAEAKKEKIKVIFAQPEFSTRSAEAIAKEINGEVRLISTMSPDWSENLLEASQTFAKEP